MFPGSRYHLSPIIMDDSSRSSRVAGCVCTEEGGGAEIEAC